MKTMHRLAFGAAALLLTGASFAQSTSPAIVTSEASIVDNPGLLGRSYLDFNYSWVDFNEDIGRPRGFIAGLSANTAVSRGLDVGLGYSYFRENNHRNPFTGTDFDVRSHQLATAATFFGNYMGSGVKPFISGAIGYQWSRGDLQSFRIDDDDWAWGASAGAEVPLGRFALTPRISYSDDFHGNTKGMWSYGGELHHWFSEKMGGYADVTFHEPRETFAPDYWTYTAGLRFRF